MLPNSNRVCRPLRTINNKNVKFTKEEEQDNKLLDVLITKSQKLTRAVAKKLKKGGARGGGCPIKFAEHIEMRLPTRSN